MFNWNRRKQFDISGILLYQISLYRVSTVSGILLDQFSLHQVSTVLRVRLRQGSLILSLIQNAILITLFTMCCNIYKAQHYWGKFHHSVTNGGQTIWVQFLLKALSYIYIYTLSTIVFKKSMASFSSIPVNFLKPRDLYPDDCPVPLCPFCTEPQCLHFTVTFTGFEKACSGLDYCWILLMSHVGWAEKFIC